MKNNKINLPATLLCDFYKTSHLKVYPKGTEVIYSTFTPRSNKYFPIANEVVVFGIQGFVKKYLVEYFNENFFKRSKNEVVNEYNRIIKFTLGEQYVDSEHIEKLHDLGYLPIKLKALKEGTLSPIKIPVMTIENTHPDFFWLTNYLETLISTEIWQPMTSATISHQYRKLFDEYALKTVGNTLGVDFQGHDFSMRGMSSLESAMTSGAGHLLSFTGTDTIPAILYHEKYYNANVENELVGASIPACYDDKTEVLAENGWKLFKDLSEGEKVAQYHEDGSIDFIVPTAYYNMPYKGKMITFTSKEKGNPNYIDFCVTPNHRMIRRKLADKSLQVFEAGSEKYHERTGYGNKNLVVVSGKIKGEKVMLTDLEKLRIAFQADGSIMSHNNDYTGEKTGTIPVRFSLKKDRKKDRLVGILESLGFEYTLNKYEEGYYSFYIKVPLSINLNKDFTWVKLSEVSSEWGNSFIEELKYWDGKQSSENTISYSSINSLNTEVVQSVAVLSGNKAMIDSYADKRVYCDRKVIYTTSILLNKEEIGGRVSTKNVIEYDSTVHCVSVPTKMLVVRRNGVVGISGNTEHSVMSAGTSSDGNRDEYETFKRIITEVYPEGFVSIVSDTYDFWKVVTETLPQLKEEIMNRNGRLVIRPDSGNPVDILCGLKGSYSQNHDKTAEEKGLIECLWDVFGGHITEQGYKVLDSHIGAIYGDSITYERAKEICGRLEAKGFASTNVVFGIGSYTFQYNTRDSFGFAMKATYTVINGEEKLLFKDPKTDDGTKRSQRGKVKVYETNGSIAYVDGLYNESNYNDDLLEDVFIDGKLVRDQSLSDIRAILNK